MKNSTKNVTSSAGHQKDINKICTEVKKSAQHQETAFETDTVASAHQWTVIPTRRRFISRQTLLTYDRIKRSFLGLEVVIYD
jgi:hypothetical protein